MAFLLKQCISLSHKTVSICEINRLKYILTEIKPGITANKNILSVVQIRRLATQNNEIKNDKSQPVEPKKIYHGPLTKQVRSIKLFTLLSSIAGICSQPVLYNKFQELGFSGLVIAMATFYGFFVFVSPFLIHLVTKRYVTTIMYDPTTGNYIAYVYNFFLIQRKIEFTPEDVKVPTITGMFTSHVIKGYPLFMDLRCFSEPKHYAKIMGYDKPIDFSIESNLEDKPK